MSSRPVLFWFRDDLRLADNAGLAVAAQSGAPIVACYLLDEVSPGVRRLGGASRWWLDKSLRQLSQDIARREGKLILRRGLPEDEIPRLAHETNSAAVVWNRRYGAARQSDADLKTKLKAAGIEAKSACASLLLEPPSMSRTPERGFKVFTPFWKAALAQIQVGDPQPSPTKFANPSNVASDNLDAWGLHPTQPDWSAGLSDVWTPGELGARTRLQAFVDTGLAGYADERNRPDLSATSRLSPHLRFGEVGPAQVWRALRAVQATGQADARDVDKLLSEIGWREFSHHLLFHDPEMTRLSWRRGFESVAWRTPGSDEMRAWQMGRTGFPIVDAGMRELWRTGWMHNRVRMIAGSFLVKDMLAHWREGEAWFWDTLVDADEANNAAGWQWVAGSGADAAPYFRVFNPTLQGETHDPTGAYVRKWVPELASLPDRWIHRPGEAPKEVLKTAGIELGRTYPAPMLDHALARQRALEVIGGVKAARKDAAA